MRKRAVPKLKEPTPRSPNRFNLREFARAVRAAAAAGAEGLELDPKTGIYRVVLPGKGAKAASGNDLDDWMAKKGKDAHQA